MAFTQQTFFGASIRDFSGAIGWGSNPSTITVRLVEDPLNGDSFVEPSVGQPALFNYSGWTFGGMVQNWELNGSSGGNPLYDIVMVDPREILDGCAIILDGYNGSTFGVPNLFNVFGYLEATGGFGSSNITSAGIPWKNVRDGLVALTQGANATYGDAISTAGFQYEIDLSALPNLPTEYRLPAQDTSIMEFIRNVCDAANHEFFFTHNPIGITNVLTLFTINRNIEPIFGAITNFIASTPGAVSKRSGFEFRNEVTSKFLVGGSLSDIFYQSSVGGDDNDFETSPEDNSIWQYWGKDSNGDLIIGDGINDEHVMVLDSRWVPPWPDNTYPSSIGEMRAAEESQSSWESYLWFNNYNYFIIDGDGPSTDKFRSPVSPFAGGSGEEYYNIELYKGEEQTYSHNDVLNPHFGKANKLNSGSMIAQTAALIMASKSEAELDKWTADAIGTFDKKSIEKNTKNNTSSVKDAEQSTQVYRYVKDFASGYYGRKYMVRIPFINTATDSETDQLQLSSEPVSAGFLEESAWPTAIANNLLPPDVNKISTPDGRILAYVRYDSAQDYDFSEIPEEAITMSSNNNSAFILVDVDETVAFLDADTSFSPRAIITLPGTIRPKDGDDSKQYAGIVAKMLTNAYKHKNTTAGAIAGKVNKILKGSVADNIKMGNQGQALLMNAAAIPIESNIQTYGPWHAGGANGKLAFEQDTSLVPWNYGGFTAMNASAQAKVDSAISLYQISEAGSIEFPDVPAITLGQGLVGGGPFLTDINVSIGAQGATTTYQMSTWTPQPFKLRKAQADFQSKSAVRAQRLRREYRELNRTPTKLKFGKSTITPIKETPRDVPESTHTIMAGQVLPDPSGDFYKATVGIQPHYLLSSTLNEDYTSKAGATLDTLFYPFATSSGVADSGIPYFQTPSSGAAVPTVTELNPFAKTTNYRAVTQGTEVQDIGNVDGEAMPDARGLALRAPIVVAGWGYDTDGNPTPSGTDGEFISNVNRRSDKWKVGPLDTRWDDNKKVWLATGEGGLIRATANAAISPGGTGEAVLLSNSNVVPVDNWLGPPICSGNNMYLTQDNSQYFVVLSQFNALEVVTNVVCGSGNNMHSCDRTIWTPAAFSTESCSNIVSSGT